MSITDYLMIIFVALIPVILILFTVQDKLEKINFRKYWDGTVSKIIMVLSIIWIVIGLLFATLGLLKLFKGSDAYGLIVLILMGIVIYFGMDILSLGIAKLIDRFSKEED